MANAGGCPVESCHYLGRRKKHPLLPSLALKLTLSQPEKWSLFLIPFLHFITEGLEQTMSSVMT